MPASTPFGASGADREGPGSEQPPTVPGSAFLDASEPSSARRPPARAKGSRGPLRSLIEWGVVIGGALVVALVIQATLFQAFYIPSESMESTLVEGDRVLVNKLDDSVGDISRGDVVVFERPPNEPPSEVHDLIKRVVGLPGDTVEGRDGVVYINGEPLDESYLDVGTITSPFEAVTVPEGHLFVMGDNRGNSRDSRFFGTIDGDLLVGRAFVIVWPLGRAGGL
jgi:signal peptidase I